MAVPAAWDKHLLGGKALPTLSRGVSPHDICWRVRLCFPGLVEGPGLEGEMWEAVCSLPGGMWAGQHTRVIRGCLGAS